MNFDILTFMLSVLYLLQESYGVLYLYFSGFSISYWLSKLLITTCLLNYCCFAGGETLPGIIYSPANKKDMLSNITHVINFMTERNIRMHVTYAEG